MSQIFSLICFVLCSWFFESCKKINFYVVKVYESFFITSSFFASRFIEIYFIPLNPFTLSIQFDAGVFFFHFFIYFLAALGLLALHRLSSCGELESLCCGVEGSARQGFSCGAQALGSGFEVVAALSGSSSCSTQA